MATADKKTRQYTFELDMVSAAEDFASLSGSYSMVSMGVWAYGNMILSIFMQALIVGDFALENPFSWDMVSPVTM